ncbi:hypothetical protein J6590_019170 [Homalodisca vitripennis]|nr:hypothetical protein J6590_019170 [Homalodisca vitripennis]
MGSYAKRVARSANTYLIQAQRTRVNAIASKDLQARRKFRPLHSWTVDSVSELEYRYRPVTSNTDNK